MDTIITLVILGSGIACIYIGVTEGENQIIEARKNEEEAIREKSRRAIDRWFKDQRRNESVRPPSTIVYTEQTTASDD